nr:hypothetical protein [Tanacetum cinerariifolium]
AWLARINELRQAANKPEWEDMFILYCHGLIIEHYMLTREINRVYVDVSNVVDEKAEFLQELYRLVGQNVPKKTIKVLEKHKRAIAWKMSDIKGISLSFCTHKILIFLLKFGQYKGLKTKQKCGGLAVVNGCPPSLTIVDCRVDHHWQSLTAAFDRHGPVESDKVIKSSVEDFVLIPSESEDTSKNDTSTSAGRSIPAASRNRPASIHAGRHIPAGRFNKPAPFLAGRSVPTGWTNHAARPFFRPTNLYFDNVHPHVNKGIGGIVTFGGGDGKITGKGTIRTSKLNFKNVYYVEELQHFNLFSVSQICNKKNKVLFTDGECLVLTKECQLPDERQVVLRIPRRHDLYTFNLSDIQPNPTSIRSIDHKYYSLVVTDDFNRFSWAFFLGTKDETVYILKDFIALIENQLNKKVKAIRDYSNPRTPQQNRVAERKNRTLIEAARSMLADSRLPTMFWTEAVSTACYVLNRVSITNPHNKTPYELLSGKVPNIRHLKPFRCYVTILNTSDHLGKFEGKANDGFLVGYAANSKAYRVYNLSSKKFLGPKVNDVSAPMENNLDYVEELGRLQRQEHEAHSAAMKYGVKFSNETAKMLHQAEIETRRNLVLAAGDPTGSIVSTSGVPAGSVPASHVPASSVSPRSVPASNVPAGGVLAGSIDSAGFGDPAASESVPAVFTPDHAANFTLPPGHSLGSSEHSIRFSSPSNLGHHQPTAGIFSSSSYDDDFCADVTNLASSVAVDLVVTKRVNTIHPQSQIIGELYSVEKALEDPDWVAAMQEEMQQFYNQQVWKLVPLPDGKIAIGTKWILKNKRDTKGIVVKNKARFVAQGHRQEEGIDYNEVFALFSRTEAIRLFLSFASYMGFMVNQMDVKSAFLYGEIEKEVYVTQPKGFEDPHNPKHVYKVIKALYGLHQAPRAWFMWMTSSLVPQIKPGVFISQDKYVKDMLKKFDMESVRTATTPYAVLKPKSKDEPNDAINVHVYRSMIGSLMYLTASRPNIMF